MLDAVSLWLMMTCLVFLPFQSAVWDFISNAVLVRYPLAGQTDFSIEGGPASLQVRHWHIYVSTVGNGSNPLLQQWENFDEDTLRAILMLSVVCKFRSPWPLPVTCDSKISLPISVNLVLVFVEGKGERHVIALLSFCHYCKNTNFWIMKFDLYYSHNYKSTSFWINKWSYQRWWIGAQWCLVSEPA